MSHGKRRSTRPHPTYTLLGPDGRPHASATPGNLGGHRAGKRYGRLDCRAALQALARGGYVRERVFFADEATALAAGYRPCAVCLTRGAPARAAMSTRECAGRARAWARAASHRHGSARRGGPAVGRFVAPFLA